MITSVSAPAATTVQAAARKIYIVDDNAEFRRSAQWWLTSAGYAVQDFADPAQALGVLRQRPADEAACLLLDVRMPGMSGLDLHDQLLQSGTPLPVVYMTGHGDVPLAVQAMQRGAVSFLEKPFAEEALEQALERAFAQRMQNPVASAPPEAAPDHAAQEWQLRLCRLTPRERELLGWIVEDKLNKSIADLMGISIKTVELHRKRVMAKLQAHSATHLIKMVISERVA